MRELRRAPQTQESGRAARESCGCSNSSKQWALDSLQQIVQIYTADARFNDPFNDVRGVAEIRRVFAKIATQVEVPSFGVTHAVCQGDDAFLTWDFVSR